MSSLPDLDLVDRSPAARRVSLHRPGEAPATALTSQRRPSLSVDVLADIATSLARAEGLWRPHVDHDPLSRTSVRLVETETYEVWLLGWTSGQRVDLHDHGGANAAFVVVEGELDEITLGFGGTTTRRFPSGAVGTVAAGVVHDVVNAGCDDATSLHVYSHPLRTMTYFDDDGTARHTEAVEQVPALVRFAAGPPTGQPAAGGR